MGIEPTTMRFRGACSITELLENWCGKQDSIPAIEVQLTVLVEGRGHGCLQSSSNTGKPRRLWCRCVYLSPSPHDAGCESSVTQSYTAGLKTPGSIVSHLTYNGAITRYRSGTTEFTAQCADHYTMTAIEI